MTEKKPKYIEGVGWRYETEHRQTRRHPTHDYGGVGTYLVTMTVAGREKVFGHVEGDLRARKGEQGYAHLVASPLAERILSAEVQKMHQFYQMVDIWKIVLMPDHLHMIVRVNSHMPKGKNLGQVIRGFKTGCCRAWWELTDATANDGTDAHQTGTQPGAATNDGTDAHQTGTQPGAYNDGTDAYQTGVAPVSSGYPEERKDSEGKAESKQRPLLFEPGYNDHILMNEGQLDSWKGYLDENPFRLLVRQRCPDIMRRALCVTMNGRRYSAFGNFMLLKVPEKHQVMCHRKATIGMLTVEERQQHGYTYQADESMKTAIAYEDTKAFEQEKTETIEAAKEGVVIVTPGISKGEQIIKHECLEQRLPLIHLQKEPITALWKPEKERFYACTSGKLLILAPWSEDLQGDSDYELFHNLNGLAAEVCSMEVSTATYGCKAVGTAGAEPA